MTTPVLRGSTAPLPGRPDGTPFGQNTLQATSPDTTLVGDLILCVSWHTYGEIGGGSALTLRSGEGWTQLINFIHNDGSKDGTLGVAWKIATLAGAQVYQAFNSSSPQTDCRTALRIYEVGTFDTTGFIVGTSLSFTDGNLAPDAPSVSGLNSTRDYMIEAIGGWWCMNETSNCIPGAPTGYSSLIETASVGWSELALAKKAVTGVTSENPGAFTDNLDATTNSGSVGATVAILGAPGAVRRAIVGQGEFEVPDPAPERRAVIGQIEFEVPNKKLPDTLTFMFHRHWARYKSQSVDPQPVTPRRAVITQAELEVPNQPRRAIVTSAELEIPSPSPATLAVGVWYRGGRPPSPTKDVNYTTFLGRTVDVNSEAVHAGSSVNDWSWLTGGSNWAFDIWFPWMQTHPGRRFELSSGMVPWKNTVGNPDRSYVLEVANGVHDAKFQTFADLIFTRAGGMPGTPSMPLYLNFGKEFGGTWFPQSCGNDPTKMTYFKNAFRRIVQVMRARQPTANWKFVLCHNTRDLHPNGPGYHNFPGGLKGLAWAEEVYPGDDVVDLIGGDFYDNGPYTSVTPSLSQQQSVWATHHLPALQNQKAHAAAHGKPQFFSELGCHKLTNGGIEGGADNPYFIEQTYNWVTDPANNFEYSIYFDDNTNIYSQLSPGSPFVFTNAAAKYVQLFGALPHPWGGG